MLAEVRKWLSDEGHGTENSTLFYAFLPPDPMDATCVFDSPGGNVVRTLCRGTSGVPYEEIPGQVQVRRAVFADALLEAEAIYNDMLNVENQTLSGTRYLSLKPQPPFTLQRDQSETPIRAINFLAQKELS